MKAERSHNPYWKNRDVTPVIVAFRDAEEAAPYQLHWKAIVTSIPVSAEIGNITDAFPDFCGFPIHETRLGQKLHVSRFDDMIAALEAADWNVPLYRGTLARITGKETLRFVRDLGEEHTQEEELSPGPMM